MTTHQSLLAFLFAACLVQGAFLAPVIARLESDNRRATLVLAALILCFLPLIGEEFISVSGLTERFPHSLASSITVDFLIAPLLLFYAWSITERDRAYTAREMLHAIPFVLASLLVLPFWVSSGEEKLRLMEVGLPPGLRVVIGAKVVIAVAYLGAAIHHLRRFVNRPGNARARDPNVVWFLRSLFALAGVAAVSVLVGWLSTVRTDVPIDSDALGTLFICSSIYLISFMLIRYPLATAALHTSTLAHGTALRPARVKYGTSPLTGIQKQDCRDRLIRQMESERPFLDMNLSLEKLADALDVRPSHLSQVLNEQVGMSFYEFVSAYRVREAQARIADPDCAGKTLLTIAHESGFNSKASFNRAFKRLTGRTPSEYARLAGATAVGRTRSD